ncbi:MAG: serine/threonine-protein kinase [Caldilineaceae bacterium]
MIGHKVGNVQIEERLGTGAMAAIYRGLDTTTGAQVAVKVLNATADDISPSTVSHGSAHGSALQHPHIVQLIDSGQTEQGITYIVMTLVMGEDLGSFLEKHHKLTVADTCRLLLPIADALAYAHAAGVIHRDVKPGNILLQRVAAGTPNSIQLTDSADAVIPLLSDFGIARALDAPELTIVGRTIGTPAYMSPEQCAGNRALMAVPISIHLAPYSIAVWSAKRPSWAPPPKFYMPMSMKH